MALTPAEILKKVEVSVAFSSWKKKHPQGYLSHFFCPISHDCELKSDWEIGFYDADSEKMSVFACGEAITVKENEDEVFKKPEQKVEELKIKAVDTSYEKAVDVFAAQVEELFPKAGRGDGFVILQNLEGKSLWNFTFITSDLKFINIKINTKTGEVDSHLSMDLIDRGQ
ncbi:MAG: hypothetical protein Q8R47_02545 [Nanoarchaeota archaeon]|nr:hypothetical protein [Nanoarchaeota archaeon]